MSSSNSDPPSRVGIVLATYNCDRDHFAMQIASIRAQDFGNWICYVTDDSSSPAIQQFIEQTLAADPRFVFQRQPHNLGAYHNFEAGVRYFAQRADITHLAFADQDDVWRADKLFTLLRAIAAERAVLAHSDLALIDAEGQLLQPSVWTYEQRHPEKMTPELLLLRNTVTGCTVMVRHDLIPQILPFPPQEIAQGWYHDYWIALVAAEHGAIAHIRQPLVQYRRHSSNAVGTQAAAGTLANEARLLLAKRGKLSFRSYRIHRDLSRAFYQRFRPQALPAANPFTDQGLNFGWPIFKLGVQSTLAGYGVRGVMLRLWVNKFWFDCGKMKSAFANLLFGVRNP